ncbi:triose-phosphate isomerase [Propionibacteriaceae bacterium G1746]|uniref:triose-phosphate isomerase n=1 Tax=Aestuariimicrobium sp. G57 TaxID=3418485 RepID=UPI003C2631B1
MLPDVLIGQSSKSYFTHAQALEWAEVVGRELSARYPDWDQPATGTFLCVPYPLLPLMVDRLGPLGTTLGTQDLSQFGPGAYTGEVSAELLAEMGSKLTMLGHPERVKLLGETEAVVGVKAARAAANGITPILVAGENDPTQDPREVMTAQFEHRLRDVPLDAEVMIAYEPTWAIGQPEPAPAEHVVGVVAALRELLADRPNVRLVYGGSAGRGTFKAIADAAREVGNEAGIPDGVFLGRFGLDPLAFLDVVDEVRTALADRL